MIPTPSTSHVNYNKVYEPAEDSFLFLDGLSDEKEIGFLKNRFPSDSISPLVCEIGSGSGVVISFFVSNALKLIGRRDVITITVDINIEACNSTIKTFEIAENSSKSESGTFLNAIQGDLTTSLKPSSVDILIFNPPYVPSSEVPSELHKDMLVDQFESNFQRESNLLALSYAGGAEGMETTNRLLDDLPTTLTARGVAYILFCAGNKPRQVIERINAWGTEWSATVIAHSGKQAGWEVLQILRICRNGT